MSSYYLWTKINGKTLLGACVHVGMRKYVVWHNSVYKKKIAISGWSWSWWWGGGGQRGGRFIVGSLCMRDRGNGAVAIGESRSVHQTLRAVQPVVRWKFTTRFHNRCIFVHMVGRDTSHSCVIMKFIYHYTWSRQIIFNSQKLVKRRWTVFKERTFCTLPIETKYQNS